MCNFITVCVGLYVVILVKRIIDVSYATIPASSAFKAFVALLS